MKLNTISHLEMRSRHFGGLCFGKLFHSVGNNDTSRMKLKFIIIDHNGIETLILFSSILSHKEVAGKRNVLSAGFCRQNVDGNWSVRGQSVSLRCSVRSNDDQILTELWKVLNESGGT